MNNIFCVIVTYNIDNKIYDVVNSVKNKVSKLIIVDNGSKENTLKMLNDIDKEENVEIIYNMDNLGISMALNIGVRKAIDYGAKWILTLDHDSIVDSEMIDNMAKFYNRCSKSEQRRIGILAPEIYDIIIGKSYYNVGLESDHKKLKHVIQSGALIKTEIFKEIGYFNEDLFIYFVDVEFCYKVNDKNYDIIMVKNAKLFHEEGHKEEKKFLFLKFTYDNYSKYSIYYIIRNAVYMFRTYKEYEFIKRIIYDFIKIILANNKMTKYVILGLKDGIFNNYGKKSF